MVAKSTHLQVIPQQSIQNTLNELHQHPRKTSEFFSRHQQGRYISARKKTITYLGSSAKFSVTVQFSISNAR